jgi:Flp pilus assembly pilin Flp
MMLHLKAKFRSFLRDEDGVVLAETLLILPFLVWTLVALFVFWDVWRTINIGQKAAYSIADLLSRQEDPVDPTFIANMENVVEFLTPGAPQRAFRVTSFEYDETADEYCLLFSATTNPIAAPEMTKPQIQQWRAEDKIPTLMDRESVFVVESWVSIAPQFDTGVLNIGPSLEAATYGEFIVTSPRHRRLVLVGNTNCL